MFFIAFIEFYKIVSRCFIDKKNILYIITHHYLSLFFCFSHVFFLIKDNYKEFFIFILLICISTDLGGYFFGKFFKGKKLTKISPNKTYSGMIGSFICSLIVFLIFYLNNFFTLNFVIFTVIISLTSQLGDLFISYLKRKAKIKDTGNLLPGHGGILDRIDGILFALPLGISIIYFFINMKKKIIILGSTGSIGSSSLNVIKKNKRDFNIICLSTNKNYKKILKQSNIYKVKNIIINNEKTYHKVLKTNKHKGVKIFNNLDLFLNYFKKKFDYIILGISGFAGLEPTLKIIPFTKNLCSANKSQLFVDGNLLKKLNQYNTNFIPIDSEHFSIWSLISKKNINSISSIYLTASGGPFLNIKKNKLKKVKVKHVIKHPNWNMGKKISTDSRNYDE